MSLPTAIFASRLLTPGSTARFSSISAERSTAASTSPDIPPPMKTASAATYSIWCVSSIRPTAVIPAAISSRPIIGKTASARARSARFASTLLGAPAKATRSASTNSSTGARRPIPSRCLPSTSARAASTPPATSSNIAIIPAAPIGRICAASTAGPIRTTSNCGASATRWTGPGRSVTNRPMNMAGWRTRRRKPCAASTSRSSSSCAARRIPT